jgi:hypothetical protein
MSEHFRAGFKNKKTKTRFYKETKKTGVRKVNENEATWGR